MFKTVRIGEQDVPMLSMASVDLYYNAIFHEDPLVFQTKMGTGEAVGFIMRMGFVMAKYAEVKERKEMLKLTVESYYDWMDGFERGDLINALEEIKGVYDGQLASSAEAKKKDDGPSES